MTDNKSNKVKVNIKHVERLKNGNFKVKIKENNIKLTSINLNDATLLTVKSLGRGRFIMKKKEE
jgi:hypothetical protein